MSDTNYKAVVFSIKSLRPIEKADRLLATSIYGNNVIVGINVKEGDKGLYFPLESQIGLEFAQANDLIRRKDAEGKPAGGMFAENRRVRAQMFRGEKSMGFWIPIDSLKKLEQGFDTQIDDLQDGDEIGEFNGKIISTKYIPANIKTPGTPNSKSKTAKLSRLVEGQFRFHKDTLQLGKNIHRIESGDNITVTYKYHGTSAIAARVLVNQPFTFLDKVTSFISRLFTGKSTTKQQYDYLYASRTVVKNDALHPGFYGEDLWTSTGKKYFEGNLKQGESIYYEIVGYTEAGKAIQKGYDYGCNVNIHGEPFNKAIVYRITYTLPDGTVVELPWNQVKERCKQLGVEPALTLYEGRAMDLGFEEVTKYQKPYPTEDEWREDWLKYLQDTYLEKDCIFHPKGVPAEGICIRKEGLELETFKLKSFRFFEWETKLLDNQEIDIETEQS